MSEMILDAEVIRRNRPQNWVGVDDSLFIAEYEKRIPSTSVEKKSEVMIFQNGFISRRWSLGVEQESFAFARHTISDCLRIAAKRGLFGVLSRERRSIGEALFITDEFSNGYFHWIGDVLPKLELLFNRYGAELFRTRTLVIPTMADFPYVRASLEPYGITNAIYLAHDESIYCQSLLTCSSVAPTGNYRPLIMRSLHDRFVSFFSETKKPWRKVFISRSKAPKRYIVNEDALMPVLESEGFERVFLELLPFPEQIKLLSETAILVGNHGAGLSNILFMQPEMKVLELRLRGDSHNNCFFSLASDMNVSYYYLQCDSARPGEDTHTANFVVDVEKFSDLLKYMQQK